MAMATEKRRRPRVGDTAWFVEWCEEMGTDENGDGDFDRNKMCERRVATREEAERVAREVYPLDKIGAVAYWPAELVAYDDRDAARYPHVGFWEATADPDYYEGENP